MPPPVPANRFDPPVTKSIMYLLVKPELTGAQVMPLSVDRHTPSPWVPAKTFGPIEAIDPISRLVSPEFAAFQFAPRLVVRKIPMCVPAYTFDPFTVKHKMRPPKGPLVCCQSAIAVEDEAISIAVIRRIHSWCFIFFSLSCNEHFEKLPVQTSNCRRLERRGGTAGTVGGSERTVFRKIVFPPGLRSMHSKLFHQDKFSSEYRSFRLKPAEVYAARKGGGVPFSPVRAGSEFP
jgi:hypothetical protein